MFDPLYLKQNTYNFEQLVQHNDLIYQHLKTIFTLKYETKFFIFYLKNLNP